MTNPAMHNLDRLPVMRFAPYTFIELPEYSSTLPTYHDNWLQPTRYWKRLNGVHDPQYRRQGGIPYWMVGAYRVIESTPPNCYSTLWFRPIIRVPVDFDPSRYKHFFSTIPCFTGKRF